MATVIEIFAGLAVLSNAVIYGTDVFGAIVQRPAMAAVDDRTLTQALGHIHLIADVRFKAIGIAGLIAAIATTIAAAVSGHWISTGAGAVASLALITFLILYTRIAKPINTALTTAALADRIPDDARGLQARWDSIINLRAALQGFALAALCASIAAA
jgi:hypothetical protein